MPITLKQLQISLAKHKVYDAWQYVQSLSQTLTFMNASHALLEKVYEHRKNVIRATSNEMIRAAFSEIGKAVAFTTDHLSRTNLNIAGLEIDDVLYLRKTALEFFHYARLSVDVLSQIVNAALFGDDAFPISEVNLPKKVSSRLGNTPSFSVIHTIMATGIINNEIEYLLALDNYMKHVKTILITVKTGFLFDAHDEFRIAGFTYRGTDYQSFDTMIKITAVRDEVTKLVEEVLTELERQVPNCLNNCERYHSVRFRQLVKETEKGNSVEYVAFFIEVKNDISEIPSQIRVMPLIIKPNDEIYSFVLDMDTIFITQEGKYESGILGKATLQSGTDSNELYKPYNITACTSDAYNEYIMSFQEDRRQISLDYSALEGEIIFLKNDMHINKIEE